MLTLLGPRASPPPVLALALLLGCVTSAAASQPVPVPGTIAPLALPAPGPAAPKAGPAPDPADSPAQASTAGHISGGGLATFLLAAGLAWLRPRWKRWG